MAIYGFIRYELVGGIPTPMKNMKISGDGLFPIYY
jgi:hypothetical protein